MAPSPLHLSHCLLRDEAEMEYLKIAQDLEMYGVSYFAITVSDESLCYDVLQFHFAWC